jgi:hypothetical protein
MWREQPTLSTPPAELAGTPVCDEAAKDGPPTAVSTTRSTTGPQLAGDRVDPGPGRCLAGGGVRERRKV